MCHQGHYDLLGIFRMFLGPILSIMATDPFPSVHQHFVTALPDHLRYAVDQRDLISPVFLVFLISFYFSIHLSVFLLVF